jgi:hypothetical protein
LPKYSVDVLWPILDLPVGNQDLLTSGKLENRFFGACRNLHHAKAPAVCLKTSSKETGYEADRCFDRTIGHGRQIEAHQFLD